VTCLLGLGHTHNIVAIEGAVPLNKREDMTPGERGKGPTKGEAELLIHESFKLHCQQSCVEEKRALPFLVQYTSNFDLLC
jgi:hypothetical protein